LEPVAGKASLHLMKMIKEELVFDVRSVINEARKEGQPAKKQRLHLNGDTKELTIEVVPIKANAKDNYFLIIFQPSADEAEAIPKKTLAVSKEVRNERISNLENQLKEARESMR